MLLDTRIALLTIASAVAASAAPVLDNAFGLWVEGTAPGSGEVQDTDASQTLPGFNHMQQGNQSVVALPEEPEDTSLGGDDDDPAALGITFEDECKHMGLGGDGEVGQTTIEGECVDEYGYWWATALNLNECAANVDGRLAYREGGNFDESCRQCILSDLKEKKGLLLKCNCMRGGVAYYTSLPMGSHVRHPRTVRPVGGRLMCGDRLGSKTPSYSMH